MRRQQALLPILAAILLTAGVSLAASAAGPNPAIFFTANWPTSDASPVSALERTLLDRLNGAALSIDAAIYSFNRLSLRNALTAAKNRGVAVRVATDDEARATDTSKPFYDTPAAAGIPITDEVLCAADVPVKIERTSGKMHNKLMVFDANAPDPCVVTGSLNWTATGDERNSEHIVILYDAETARAYTAAFIRWWNGTPPKVGCGAEVLLRNLYLPFVSGGTATGAPVPTLVVTPGVTMAPTAEPTAAATATATATNTETPSSTPSATTTQAETPSPVPTATATQAGTPSLTPIPTATTTSTATPTATATSTATATQTETPSPTLTSTPTPTATATTPAGPCACSENLYSCQDFGTQVQAQACFDWCMQVVGTDVHQLDSDGDGVACESLPLGWQVYGTADADEPGRPQE